MAKKTPLNPLENLHLIDDPDVDFPVKVVTYGSEVKKAFEAQISKSPLQRIFDTLKPEEKPLLYLDGTIYALPEQNASAILQALQVDQATPSADGGLTDPLYAETKVYSIPRFGETMLDRIDPFAVDIFRASAAIGQRTVVWIAAPYTDLWEVSSVEVEERRQNRKSKILSALSVLGDFDPVEPQGYREYAESPNAVRRCMDALRTGRLTETMVHHRTGLGEAGPESDGLGALNQNLYGLLRELTKRQKGDGDGAIDQTTDQPRYSLPPPSGGSDGKDFQKQIQALQHEMGEVTQVLNLLLAEIKSMQDDTVIE